MQGFWIKFTDGSGGYCQGANAFDAVQIAEKLTGKTVAVEDENKWQPQKSNAVKTLPYPANPVIWQLDHPVSGKTPTFCIRPTQCAGHTSCPQNYSCTE